jgi:hypothetical protein
MACAHRIRIVALTLTLASVINGTGLTRAENGPPPMLAQAAAPPTATTSTDQPTPMSDRMLKRFPQPVRVGDLIGLPVLDENSSTLGHVRQVVWTPKGDIELIVTYSKLWGWFGRPVAVPLEVVGIEGRQLVSLDMDPEDYDRSPTWRENDATALTSDATIRIALARN